MKKDQKNTSGKFLKKEKKRFVAPLSKEVTSDPATDPTSDSATDPTSGPEDPVSSSATYVKEEFLETLLFNQMTPAPAASEHESAHTGTEEEVDTDETTVPSSQRTKPLWLAPELERELAEWLHSNQFLYDRSCISYKDTQRKTQVLQEKAASLDPPLTAAELRRWIHSMRTRYGRLTKAKSGSGASKPPTERDQWILQIFDFMGKHIVRHKATKTLGIKESAAAVAAAPAELPPPPPSRRPSRVHNISEDSDADSSVSVSEQSRPKRQRSTPSSDTSLMDKLLDRHETATRALSGQFSSVDEETDFWRTFFSGFPLMMRGINMELATLLNIELSVVVQRYHAMTKSMPHQQSGEVDLSAVPLDIQAVYKRANAAIVRHRR
ncbi:hypothetical protein Pmani_006265 [Petrolisthes manimaculis]|uniref:MADF domain-containing protein n=1 Tax=Petrolisthes manimaculis TaxID=1843537 RepID=A0AAE1UM23_9EUCA|nr:hypothetical protein Pmani_006265 [Petrolisthes manimaculis]